MSIFAIGLNIILAFSLARPSAYGISGLAIAQSIVATIEVVILSSIMLYRDHKLIDHGFLTSVLKVISVTGFSVLTAFIMISFLPLNAADRGFITLGGKLSLISATVLFVHVWISSLFDLEEANAVLSKTVQLIIKPIKINQ